MWGVDLFVFQPGLFVAAPRRLAGGHGHELDSSRLLQEHRIERGDLYGLSYHSGAVILHKDSPMAPQVLGDLSSQLRRPNQRRRIVEQWQAVAKDGTFVTDWTEGHT